MKNLLVVRDTLDQLIIVDMSQVKTDYRHGREFIGKYYFEEQYYLNVHLMPMGIDDNNAATEADRILAEWKTIEANQTFVNPKVLCWEVCTDETRYKVTRDMPDWIVAYVDYIDPLKDRAIPIEPAPEPEYQYIYRRTSDGALWPTPFQVVAAGWIQISGHPINGRHEVGDTVLIHDRAAKAENALRRGTIAEVQQNGCLLFTDFSIEFIERCINFTKGDHLPADEREAWHQESTGFQESYYSTFNRTAQ